MANEMGVISAAELRSALERKDAVFVLDVRPTSEAQEWWIPGRTHVDAYSRLWAGDASLLTSLKIPGGAMVVTVCGGGNTSLLAANALSAQGLNARSLTGGMRAWGLAWNTAEVPLPKSGATVVQVRRTGKGCLSYMVASNGEAVVIDAAVPSEVYLALAAARGWKIRAVLETHVHADHLWRGRDLAQRAGATLYLPRQDRVAFAATLMDEGTEIAFGAVKLRALHTPGHTNESMTFQLGDEALFTGDTLFLDSVGRPDLAAADVDGTRARARLLRASLMRLAALSPELLVFPAHTSKPVAFDGVALTVSLGDARAKNTWFAMSESEFVDGILARIPPAPANHLKIIRLNETGLGDYADAEDLEAGGNRCAAV